MTPTQTLTELGLEGVIGLQESLDRKGLNASGRLRASFAVSTSEVVNGYKMQITTSDGKTYWQFVNAASRPAGGKPPIDVLIKWSEDKGLTFQSDQARRSFAFAVATNIAKGLYMRTFRTEERKNFATDVFESDRWKIRETQTVANIAREMTHASIGSFFNRPQPAQ